MPRIALTLLATIWLLTLSLATLAEASTSPLDDTAVAATGTLLLERVERQAPADELQALANGELDLQSVLNAPDPAWRPLPAVVAEGDGAYWLRLRVRNATATPLTRLLVTDYPAADSISLHIVTAEGDVRQEIASVGTAVPFEERGVEHRRAITSLQLAAGETAVLLWHVESHPLFRFRTAFWQPEAFQRNDHNRSLLFGMLYGALLIMAVYNLFLWLSLREKHYLFYVIYLLCTGYTVGAEEGHVYQYLLPGEAWPKTATLTLVNMLAVAAFYGFSAAFLRLRRNQSQLFQWMRALGLFNIALLLLGGVFEQQWAMRSALVMVLPFYLIALWAGVRLRLRGFLPAGYYVVAVLLLVGGVSLNNLMMLGILPGNDAIESYNAIGTVLMTAFFSLALANKINQLQRDSDQAAAGIAHAHSEIYRINNELVQARTERASLEQAFTSAREESHAKSEFLASLGHEIRTPMSGLLGMAELLRKTDLDASQLHYVQVIERSGHALLDVIGDLMDYTIIEAGAMDLDIDTFELETLIDDCIAIFTLHSAEKSIALFAQIDAGVEPLLRGDRRKLQQILLNLIANAFKFTESGEILLHVSRSERAAVNSIELRFEVRDTGIGLSEQMRAELFNPFATANAGDTGRSHHLGLAICRQLVELMDGEIGADGSVGHGANVWFTARFLTLAGNTPQPQPFERHHLLLLAPPGMTTDALRGTLEQWGASVNHVVNVTDARSALRDQPYDLLVLDQQIGEGSSGLQALAALQTGNSVPPILLMTGPARSGLIEDPVSAGITFVLEKPLGLRTLRETVSRALGLTPVGAAEQSAAPADYALLRVLVAEDNPVNRMVLTSALRQLGIEAQVADDGLQTVELFQRDHVDIVFIDCEMPELDGYATAERLRLIEQREGRAPARLVAVSGHGGSDFEAKTHAAGMDAALAKPLSIHALSAQLALALAPPAGRAGPS